jgi:hypothetical protein
VVDGLTFGQAKGKLEIQLPLLLDRLSGEGPGMLYERLCTQRIFCYGANCFGKVGFAVANHYSSHSGLKNLSG